MKIYYLPMILIFCLLLGACSGTDETKANNSSNSIETTKKGDTIGKGKAITTNTNSKKAENKEIATNNSPKNTNTKNTEKEKNFSVYNGKWTSSKDSCNNGLNLELEFVSPTKAKGEINFITGASPDVQCNNANIEVLLEPTTQNQLVFTFNEKGIANIVAEGGMFDSALYDVSIDLKGSEIYVTTRRKPPVNNSVETYFNDETLILHRDN